MKFKLSSTIKRLHDPNCRHSKLQKGSHVKQLSMGDDSKYSYCEEKNIYRHYSARGSCYNTSRGDQFCLIYGQHVVYKMEDILLHVLILE